MDEGMTVEIGKAFFGALRSIHNVVATETADTGKYKYNYASLEVVLEEVKRVCAEQRLAMSQMLTTATGEDFAVITRIVHESGEFYDFPASVMTMPKDPQAFGAAATYLRRYSLLAIFGIAAEDDDAQQTRQPEQARRVGRVTRSNGGTTYRTREEAQIREMLAALPAADVRELQTAFREHFGSNLSSLPPERHAEALGWAEYMLAPIAEKTQVHP